MVLVGSLPDCVYPFESSDGVLDVYYFISVNSDMYPFDFDYLCILVIVGLLVCLFVVSVLRCFSTGFCPKLMQLYPVLSMVLDFFCLFSCNTVVDFGILLLFINMIMSHFSCRTANLRLPRVVRLPLFVMYCLLRTSF